MRRRFLTAVLGVSMSGGLCLLACSSDDDPAAVTGGPDAATTETSTSSDTGAKVDSGGSSGTDATTNTDATTTDATTEAGVDAGPTRTVETKSTGNIHLAAVYVLANFFEDDTVIRWSNAPECMIIVRSPTKPASTAGTITIGGQIVGADGGPASEITLDNPPDYFSDQFLLPPTSEFTVDVSEGPGSPAFPALAKQTIRPSLGTPVTVNAPLPDAGTATIPVAPNTAFTVTWAVPTGDISEQRFVVDLAFFASGADGSKRAEVLCDTGLSAGTFTVPAEVMTDALAQTLPISGTPSSATLTLYAGGQKVVTVKNAVYVITAAPDESTTLPVGTSVSLP